MAIPSRYRRPNQKSATGLIRLTPRQVATLNAATSAVRHDVNMKTSSGIIARYGAGNIYTTALKQRRKTSGGL